MTDLSNFSEEDITRWPEDENIGAHVGGFTDDCFEGEDGDAGTV